MFVVGCSGITYATKTCGPESYHDSSLPPKCLFQKAQEGLYIGLSEIVSYMVTVLTSRTTVSGTPFEAKENAWRYARLAQKEDLQLQVLPMQCRVVVENWVKLWKPEITKKDFKKLLEFKREI